MVYCKYLHYLNLIRALCLLIFISCSNSEPPKIVNPRLIEEFKDFDHSSNRTLNLKNREPNALKGSEIVENIVELNLEEREAYIFKQVIQGNIPDFLRALVRVSSRILTAEGYIYVTYYALPDYLALGSDDDYFLCPLTPLIAQKIAIELDCFLPTKRMVDQIWKTAKVKMDPQPIPPSNEMTTVAIFQQHNSKVWSQRKTFLGVSNLGNLVSGHKKDVVISNLIYKNPDKKPVVIYGWHHKNGKIIQPLYAGHHENYVDYSHGIRLIQNKIYVDDVEMLAPEVLKSKKLKGLLSDEGILLNPFYPN